MVILLPNPMHALQVWHDREAALERDSEECSAGQEKSQNRVGALKPRLEEFGWGVSGLSLSRRPSFPPVMDCQPAFIREIQIGPVSVTSSKAPPHPRLTYSVEYALQRSAHAPALACRTGCRLCPHTVPSQEPGEHGPGQDAVWLIFCSCLPPPCVHTQPCMVEGREGWAAGRMDEEMSLKSFADAPSFHRGREGPLQEPCREDVAPDLGPG